MGRTKRDSAGAEPVILKRLGARLALVAAGVAMNAGLAAAAPESDCGAVNRGALNVELAAEAAEIRQVALRAGDRLTFNFEATAAGPFGTLILRQETGAPRSLLVGPTGTTVSFVAARGGAFRFEFSKDGAATAAFVASCVPSGDARRHSAAASSRAARRSARLLGGTLQGAGDFETAQLDGIVLDAGVPAPSRNRAAPWADDTQPAPADRAAPGGALDMKMQWRGERYTGVGPDGLQVDTSTSGVDAALNYKPLPEIMVGALAQVDQPGETLIGAPPALSDQGWMAGPVTTVKLARGLTFDARAAWGVAESATDPLAVHTVSASRRMVSARLADTHAFGPWRFTPSVSLNHLQWAGAAPVPDAQDAAASQAAGFGRVDVGPEFAYRIDLDKSAFIEPRAVIGSFWEIDSLSNLGPGSVGHGDMRLKAEAGVTIGAGDGTKLQAKGGVEEGAQGAADVWSGRLQLSVPMK